MAHTVRDQDGVAWAGDPDLSDALKEMADANPGHYVVDDSTGTVVYPLTESVQE